MTHTPTDQTPDDILGTLIGNADKKKAKPQQDETAEHSHRFIRLGEFLGNTTAYARSLILGDFDAAVASSQIDAVALTGEPITVTTETVSGEQNTVTRADELIRDSDKAQSWKGEKIKHAARTHMLHSGQIEATLPEIEHDTARFTELLALRRAFARQQTKAKAPLATQAKTRPKNTKKPPKPAKPAQ
jgi:hypothetical protein